MDQLTQTNLAIVLCAGTNKKILEPGLKKKKGWIQRPSQWEAGALINSEVK